ncbi:hypothetical protein FRB93_008219 [Tulasnella sp. JGI-2019a]|nr:hypothetical protein FRB93_008219 [Tulasnella sp. JGI-2019a]
MRSLNPLWWKFALTTKTGHGWQSTGTQLQEERELSIHVLKKKDRSLMPVLLVTVPEGQIKKFLKSGHFTFEKGKKEMTFFTQGAVSHGSHIVINLTNCPDVQAEVAQGAYQMFAGIIAFSSKTGKEWKPRQFHIARVETNNQGIVWRVHFKANQEQLV